MAWMLLDTYIPKHYSQKDGVIRKGQACAESNMIRNSITLVKCECYHFVRDRVVTL